MIGPFDWYFELYLGMTKLREKSGRNEEERGGFSSPSLPTPLLCPLFLAPLPLSEHLEQAILAVKRKLVSVRKKKKDTKAMTNCLIQGSRAEIIVLFVIS